MTNFIRIGNRAINLDLITHIKYTDPKDEDDPEASYTQKPILLIYMIHGGVDFGGEEATKLWNFLSGKSVTLGEKVLSSKFEN